MRYVLCSIAPENKDSDFSWKDFQARNNNELCSIFGNFVNRTLVLTKKYYNGNAPSRNDLLEVDIELLKTIKEILIILSKQSVPLDLEMHKEKQ